MSKLLIIFGTRPEIIKLAPVILEFRKRNMEKNITILNTNQHKDLIRQYFDLFDITPDYNLDTMNRGQSLPELTARTISRLQSRLEEMKKENRFPEFILAQGDTNTVFASAIVAFLNNIKFAHLEAGLRTFDYHNPYPEEYYRKVASLSTEIHFAPTEIAKENLIKEGINGEKIIISGNTIVDSLMHIKKSEKFSSDILSGEIKKLLAKENLVLITCHRRENHGANLMNLIKSVKILSEKYPQYNYIWVSHPNPNVKNILESSGLKLCRNVHMIDPVSYIEMIALYGKLSFIMTDSGGIQEEAPTFKIPLTVLGKKTERMEGILEGFSFLSGTEESEITGSFEKHLNTKVDISFNPYGDGKASVRIADYFEKKFG